MKFIADSCWNFSLPAVDGDVSISTAMYSGVVCERSSEKVSIVCGTLSSRITKSFFVRPGTNWPFLSVTVIGNRTRRIATLTVPCGSSGIGVGEGFGFCAATDSAAAETMTATDKYLNKIDVTRADMLIGL